MYQLDAVGTNVFWYFEASRLVSDGRLCVWHSGWVSTVGQGDGLQHPGGYAFSALCFGTCQPNACTSHGHVSDRFETGLSSKTCPGRSLRPTPCASSGTVRQK